ncbi:hypothetical protein SAMN05192540_1550 [Maribacter dokdonensis]|uniref:Uncharacterized protein n=1 Tax=Maribacter dokdonensis TaxID=320912 RepID=A0A1H4M895_9FLAO|nr:hypothetical protein [Maribacter dokdonensis]SEB78984.1 hypothetical protein SAMN05192540_1550 [Maribacter dokdonensis]
MGKINNTNRLKPRPTSFPWHIHIDKDPRQGAKKSGRLIHVEEPLYECSFYVADEPIEVKGFSTHDIENGVQLYGVTLPNDEELTEDIKGISASMKDGAHFLYNILYPAFFRKMSDKEKVERAINEHYEYYSLRGVPVRLVFNNDGDVIGSDTFNIETEKLELSGDMAQIMSDPHSEKITEDEFDDLCNELISKKK